MTLAATIITQLTDMNQSDAFRALILGTSYFML